MNGVSRIVGPNGAVVDDDQIDAPPARAPQGFNRGDAPPPPAAQARPPAPNAPTTVGFVHWVLFDIPASVAQLDGGAGAKSDAGVGATHGFTDFGVSAYGGPCPPPGDPPHRYHLTVWALDQEKLGVDETTTYAKFRFMIRGHVLASGELVGLYASPAT